MTKEAIFLGMILGLISSWRNKTLLSVPKFKNLSISGIGMCIFFISLNMAIKSQWIFSHFGWIHGISLLVIAVGCFLGKHLAYFIIGLGCALNGTVVLLNGAMPVDVSALLLSGDEQAIKLITEGRTLTHVLANEESCLTFLGDRFLFSSLITSARVISIGDVVIAFGLFLFIASAVSYVFRR